MIFVSELFIKETGIMENRNLKKQIYRGQRTIHINKTSYKDIIRNILLTFKLLEFLIRHFF